MSSALLWSSEHAAAVANTISDCNKACWTQCQSLIISPQLPHLLSDVVQEESIACQRVEQALLSIKVNSRLE